MWLNLNGDKYGVENIIYAYMYMGWQKYRPMRYKNVGKKFHMKSGPILMEFLLSGFIIIL